MPQVHDRGGWPGGGPIDRTEHARSAWETQTHGLLNVLAAKDLMRVDELRRAIEGLGPAEYEQLGYYDRWITAIEQVMVEKGVVTREEIDRKVRELEAAKRW